MNEGEASEPSNISNWIPSFSESQDKQEIMEFQDNENIAKVGDQTMAESEDQNMANLDGNKCFSSDAIQDTGIKIEHNEEIAESKSVTETENNKDIFQPENNQNVDNPENNQVVLKADQKVADLEEDHDMTDADLKDKDISDCENSKDKVTAENISDAKNNDGNVDAANIDIESNKGTVDAENITDIESVKGIADTENNQAVSNIENNPDITTTESNQDISNVKNIQAVSDTEIKQDISDNHDQGDSVSSLLPLPDEPPCTPPNVISPSDDLSFDLISRQKLSLTPQSIGSVIQDRLSPRGAPGVPVFEEDTRSSWSVESTKVTPVKEPLTDENSQNSFESQKSSLKRPYSDDEPDVMTFPPENVFEYMWPVVKGEFYFLQEQISDYLGVKSFRRKYPDLQRRVVDIAEKEFLRERGVVTETQCDLGLTALRSDDVLELMSKDYPDKYKSYIQVLREKEKQNLTEKQKEHNSAIADKNRMAECLKKAIKSASEYNAHLNQERREERRACYDLQTFTIHYPVGVNKVKYIPPKMGKYPVALLPGQFQDSYKIFTPEELKYLPLNTVLYGPLQEIKSIQAMSDASHSDSEDSTASDGSCSSSQGTHDDGSGDSTSGSDVKPQGNNQVSDKNKTPYKSKDKSNAVCKVCKLGSGTGKEDKNEPFIQCSQCESTSHPTCLQLTLGVVDVLKTYPWQCMDCKNCSHCRDPNDEDKMLFCDNCDRGYHTFCVGLKNLPQGKWICQLCGHCGICGANKPGPDPSKVHWQYDTPTGEPIPNSSRRPQIVCHACFKRKR